MIIQKSQIVANLCGRPNCYGYKPGEPICVVGWPVIIEGFEEFRFLVDERVEFHEGDMCERGFFVSELSCGALLAVGDSREEALVNVTKKLQATGKDAFTQAVAEAIARFGELNVGVTQ